MSPASAQTATVRPANLGELLHAIPVDCVHGTDWQAARLSGLSLDSRQVESGDLYLALPGRVTHGLAHAEQALARGAVAILGASGAFAQHADALERVRAHDAIALECDALDAAVNEIASRCFGHPDAALRLVAVTGTDGKTSVCRFVAEAFAALGERAGYIGTLGWGLAGRGDDALDETALTTPDAVALRRMLRALADAGADTVALEASSHGLAEGRLDGLAIDIAVLTNLGRDHLDYHGTEAAYAAAKTRLFDWPGLTGRVLNADDRLGQQLATRGGGELALFRLDTTDAPLPPQAIVHTLRDIDATPAGLCFQLDETHGEARAGAIVRSPLLGRFNVQNLAACAGVLRLAGVPFDRMAASLSTLHAVAGRMQRVGLPGAGPTVIVDYAHTPEALTAAIAAARAHCPGCLWVIFGCGGDRDTGKRAPMAQAAMQADRIIVTDDNPRTESSTDIIAMIMRGFDDGHPDSEPARVIPDRAEAIGAALRMADPADVVLIAGKGHEDYQLIGTERIAFSDKVVAEAALVAL